MININNNLHTLIKGVKDNEEYVAAATWMALCTCGQWDVQMSHALVVSQPYNV